MQPDDAQWRRPEPTAAPYGEPAGASPSWSSGAPAQPGLPRYSGPPVSTPPPAGWRPAHIIEPAPPRTLPQQDHAGLDLDEARARTFTQSLGIAGGVVLIVILVVLCGRLLF